MYKLLLPDEDIPLDVRTALHEGRDEDAGRRLMEVYDLSCDEVTALFDAPVCLCPTADL